MIADGSYKTILDKWGIDDGAIDNARYQRRDELTRK